MIVACERCESRFRLDDSLLKDEGSRVRCSRCGHVFLVRPPREEPPEPETPPPAEGPAEETVVLDSPSVRETPGGDQQSLWEQEPEAEEFDLQEEAEEPETELGAREEIETAAPEDLMDLEEAPAHLDDAFAQAEMEDRVTLEDAEEGVEEEPEPPPSERTAPAGGSGRRFGPAAVVIALVLLAAAAYAGLYLLSPGWIPESLRFGSPYQEPATADPGVKRLSFADVKGAFVRTEAGKQRFVIRGEIINNYPGARRFIQVKASILDGKGRTVRARTAYAGNVFTQGELMGQPMAFLEKGMDRRAGKESRNAAVASGGGIPFMVVFQDLPKDISEFTVEAVHSTPAGTT